MATSPDAHEGGFESLAGRLLVARPSLLDPNFYRTVLYIVEHSEEGALGLVLNRPTEEPVSDHLDAWAAHVASPPVVFIGGPVANEIAVGLIAGPHAPPDPWEPTPGGIGLVDPGTDPDALEGTAGGRVYSGYSGWVTGQLEMEVATGSWVVTDGGTDDVFTAEPETLWRRVLRRQRDRSSLYAWFPDDIRTN